MLFLTSEKELTFLVKEIRVLYFYADWLLSHKKNKIMIEKVENLYKNIKFYAIDIDNLKNSIRRYNISTIPTFIITKDFGEEVKKFSGIIDTKKFINFFDEIYVMQGKND